MRNKYIKIIIIWMVVVSFFTGNVMPGFAQNCLTPVLLSDIPGNKEWITPGKQGWLFKDGDVHALALSIIQVVEQRKKLKKIGENARQLAEERADWSKNFEKLLQGYELARGLYV